MRRRLAAVDQALTGYDQAVNGPERVTSATAAIRAALGPDALATSEFAVPQPVRQMWGSAVAESSAGHLTRHLDRDFPVDDWLQGVARVRPRMAMWERIAQLAGAIGTGEPDLLPAQFPFSVGDPWLALELPRLAWRHLNPSSGLDNRPTWTAVPPQVAAKFAVAGDFDGDGRDEIAVGRGRRRQRGATTSG